MRILSARVIRARRNRATSEIEAVVSVILAARPLPRRLVVPITVVASAPGAAPLRARILGNAKLAVAASALAHRAA